MRTTLDASGITQLQGQLASINTQLDQMASKKLLSQKEVYAAQGDIQKLGKALTESLNPQTGLLDLSKFRQQLKGLSLSQLEQSMSKVGATGQQAFGNMIAQIGRMDTSFKSISSFADKIFNTMGNTVRWGVTASIFQTIQNSLYRAVDYVQELDTSLNNIRIVTSASNQDMRDFALYANEAAQAVGASTTSFTNAAQLYAQNGFNEEDYTRLAEITTKVANVTQQNTVDVSEQITALMEGYHMTIDQVEESLGGMAVVAAASAADLEELATAEQKVASTANTVGVSHEQLTAQIGTIVSVTRQAPESVGNAMRTLYARIADLRMGETLEDGTTLGNLSGTLADIGINVTDAEGNLRNLGDVLEELQDKWGELSNAQQIALGTKLAGKYQLNPFMALMENADMYQEQLEMMQTSGDALEEQQAIYMDSMAAKLQSLTTAGEGFISTLFNADDFKPFIEGLTEVVNTATDFVDVLGGLQPLLTGLGSLGVKVFSNQIGQSLNNMLTNYTRSRNKSVNPADLIAQLGGKGLSKDHAASVELIQNVASMQNSMSVEQQKAYNDALLETVDLENRVIAAKQNHAKVEEELNQFMRMNTFVSDRVTPGGVPTKDTNEALAAQEQSVQATNTAIDTLTERYNLWQDTLQKLENGTQTTSKSLTTLQNSFTKMGDAVVNSLKAVDVPVDDFLNSIKQLGNAADAKTLRQQIELLKQFIQQLKDSVTGQEQAYQAMNEQIERLNQAQAELKAIESATSAKRDSNDVMAEGLITQTQLQNITAMLGGLGQLIFAVQTFHSLGSLWDNDDLTSAEKMLQTILLLSSALPSLISAFTDLKAGVQSTVQVIIKVGNALSDFKWSDIVKNIASIGTASTATGTAVTGMGTAAAGASVGITTLGAALAKIATVALPIVAVVGAIGAGLYLAWQEYTKDARAAEKAAEASTRMAQAAQATQAELDTLNDSINTYHEAQSAVYALTEGTQEWRDAIAESNDEVLSLLDSYPELAKYISRGEGGLLRIDESGFEALQDLQEQQILIMNATNTAMKNRASRAQTQADATELRRSIRYREQVNPPSTSSPSSQPTYTVSSLSEGELNTILSMMETEGELSVQNAEMVADALGVNVSDPIVASITENADKIIQFNTQTEANRAAERIRSEQTAQAFLNAQEGYDPNNPNNNALVAAIANATDQDSAAYQQALQDVEDDAEYDNFNNLLKEYQNLTGDTYSEISDNWGDDDSAQFTTASGQSYTATRQDIEAALAAAQVMGDMAGSWQTLANQIETISSTDLGRRYEELPSIIAAGNKDKGFDFAQLDSSELSNIAYGDITIEDLGLTDEMIANAGFEDGAEYIRAFQDAAKTELNNRDWLDHYTGDEISGFLSANDIDEADFSNYANELRDNLLGDSAGELSFDYKTIQDNIQALKEQQQAVTAGSDEYNEYQAQIDEANAQLEQYDEIVRDIAVDTIKTQKGLEALNDVLDENADIILHGDKNSQQYADSLNAVRDTVAQVLNVNAGALSDDFLTSADNLNLMREAANGSQEALEQLRMTAAQDIIQNVQITGVDDESAQALKNNLANLAAQLPDVEVGASIDDTPFVQALDDMLLAGQLSVEEMNNILSGMGYDVTVDYVPVSVPSIEYTLQEKLSSVGGGDNGITAGIAGAVSALASTAYDSVPMPRIHTTKRGGGGSGWKPSGSTRSTPSGGGGGGGGGRGGGGGGGSGKSYEPKTKDPVEDELDRYERVNAELDTLANRYEAVADEQERLAGFDVADNISEQIGLIKQQIKWQEEKLKIQKEEAEEYRNQLASQYGITYDAEGHITNYADVYKRLLNNLNSLINQYNNTTTESGQEALDKQIEAAQENFDKYTDLIEKYDELVSNSILESEKEIQDFYDQIEDLQIEAFEKAVDSVDNLKDLQETLIDFNAVFTGLDSDSPFRDMITSLENLKTYWDINTVAVDDYYDELIKRNEEAMKNASEQRKEELEYQNKLLEAAREQYGKGTFEAGGTGLFDMAMNNLNTILEQMRQYEETGTSTIFGENAGSMYEVGNDIFEQATSLLEDYEGHLDDLHDSIIDAIDEIGDKMDERLETYENINDELEHYADIIEMVQGENSYEQLNQVSQATIANNQATINELKQNIALWQDLLAAMEEGSEEWKTINEYISDAQQELLEKTSDTIEEMLEMYERGVNDILDKWIGSTGMGDDLDWIAEEWELINRNADYYLDDVNAAYEIQKLQGKYLDLLDNADQLDIQNQITQQMQQQLAYLREKDKLSEYDVQYANAQLEILQKQIALQEAQRNKSQLQLRRDNQGNYSYVYTADENDTREAQGDLLDAQNNAYNLSKEQMKQTQDDSLSALQDARDTLEQIWTNANLTLEEKTKRTQTIIDSLKEYLAGTSEQLSESEKNIINDFIGMCDILTDENDERLQDVYEQIINGNKDAFDQIDTRWQTSITNWLQNMEDFNIATDESFQDLIDNFEGYQTSLDELGDLAGMTFDDMSDSIQNAVDKTDSLASSTASFINQLKNDAGTIKEYEDALAEMTAKIQDAENGMRAYQEQVNQLQQNLTAKEQENANLSSQVKDLQSQIDAMRNPGGSGGSSGGSGGGANSDTAWGIAKAIWTYGGASGWGNDPIRSSKLTKAYGSDFARQVQTIINQNYRSGKLVDYGSMKYSSYNLIGYKQGGYLGNRFNADEIVPNSDGGKLFIGHPGELILNQEDTANILNAVDMVRTMVATARNGNYNDIIRQSGGVIDMDSIKDTESQNGAVYYQVECNFPNATNVEDIQKAILTLPDIAPQYAYKS